MNRIDAILKYTKGDSVLDLGAVQHDAANANNDDWLHDHLRYNHGHVIGVDILEDDVRELQSRGV